MPGNLGELIQMITGLSQIQDRRRQLDLSEEQLHNQASQFSTTQQSGEFTQALKLIAGSSAKARQGMKQLVGSLAPQYQEAAMSYLNSQPVDPSVIHAGNVQTGDANMDPSQRAVVQNEAAVGNSTGMNVGQMGASQLVGQLAGGAQAQVTPQMMQDFAQRTANSQTPVDAAVGHAQIAGGMVPGMASIGAGQSLSAPQAANLGVQQNQLAQGWAGLEQKDREMALTYGLNRDKLNAKLGPGGILTGQEWLDAVTKLPAILNDMNSPKADKVSNQARAKVYNLLVDITGVGADKKLNFGDVGGGASPIHNFISGFMGNGASPTPWPTMSAPVQQQRVSP